MSQKLRILITGFGPFPGAPFNPTMPLVKRLTQLRRPAFADVELIGPIFHVTYATVYRQLPELIAHQLPLPARDGVSRRKGTAHRITLEELVDAGEAMLLEMARLSRRSVEFLDLEDMGGP